MTRDEGTSAREKKARQQGVHAAAPLPRRPFDV
jgi:hypothetical protein